MDSKGVALITGASRGIGRGIALTLARHGYDIVACATKADPSNREKGVYEVKDRVEELGRQCLPLGGDISKVEDHRYIITQAVDTFGGIDVLVNNAGISPKKRMDILETTPESVRRLLNVNLEGPFFLTQAVAHQMRKQVAEGKRRSPAIIFITSISANTASPNRAEYCLSKAGLSMAAQNFAVRLADEGIHVFEIRPGIIKTDMTAPVTEKYDRLIEEGLLLQRRWGTPDDIAQAAAAFAEGYFDYAQGAVVEIGGGFSVLRL